MYVGEGIMPLNFLQFLNNIIDVDDSKKRKPTLKRWMLEYSTMSAATD